jgi:hypothetical protein
MIISKLLCASMFVTMLVACSSSLDRMHEERGTAEVNRQLERQGSPFRFALTDENRPGYGVAKRYVIGSNCTSAAATDPRLKADVIKSIGSAEMQFGGSTNPEIVETRCVSSTGPLPQTINEVWLILRGTDKIAYTVTMRPGVKGGTDLEIHGPFGKAP